MASPNNFEGGWHPPNNQALRGDAITVASPEIKLVATKFTRQFTTTTTRPLDLLRCKCEKVNQKISAREFVWYGGMWGRQIFSIPKIKFTTTALIPGIPPIGKGTLLELPTTNSLLKYASCLIASCIRFIASASTFGASVAKLDGSVPHVDDN
jgi:hypothetical protein